MNAQPPPDPQVIFYLEFVLAAYAMYEANPHDLTPPAQGFPDSNYKIHYYLTSIDPDSGDRVFFGFLAVDATNPDVPELVAIRGTDNLYEWMTDVYAVPTAFPPYPGTYVETGFYEFVQGIEWLTPQGAAVDPAALPGAASGQQLVLAGHSLGGAMATLIAATWLVQSPDLALTVVTAASPAVGDLAFATRFNAACSNSWRYINEFDVIASFLDLFYTQVANKIEKHSYDIWMTPECEHSLYTYIWLLSPPGTTCGFDCCIVDEAVRQTKRAVLEPRRAARAAAA